jgi:hypothetical protein
MGNGSDVRSWAEELFSEADLGDVRRTRRLVRVSADLAEHAGSSPAQASDGAAAAEGMYRLLRNDEVSSERIGLAGFRAVARQAKTSSSVLLAVEDTTTLAYTHQVASELGDLGGPGNSRPRGYFVHSALLLEAKTGATLGLLDQEYWLRPVQKRGLRHARRTRRYEDKESFKWQRSSERLRERLGPEVLGHTVSVCDREADVYEYLQYKLEHQERFVVRAAWDRSVEVESGSGEPKQLFSAVANVPAMGTLTVEIPQRGGRPARQAKVVLRATTLHLRRPRAERSGLAKSLEVNAIAVREERPPKGVEPLSWTLLTTEPTATHDEIFRVLQWYRLRWRVEEFHKAWKSGTGIEERRLQSGSNILRLATILAFVAVRLLQLREFAQTSPDEPCDSVLPQIEWQVLWAVVEKTPPPAAVPSMKWAFLALGKLARWKDSKGTGRIGWETFWTGWSTLQKHIEGVHAATLLRAHAK